jgi:hypothetical protein
VDGDGVPVACAATAANVNDTLAFERLFLAAFAVMARIWTAVGPIISGDAARHLAAFISVKVTSHLWSGRQCPPTHGEPPAGRAVSSPTRSCRSQLTVIATGSLAGKVSASAASSFASIVCR